jgi:hypothetical protein
VKAISAPESNDLTSVHGGDVDSQVVQEKDEQKVSASINPSSMPLIWPEESYAYAFSITKMIGQVYKVAGYAEIKWCSYMGEHGTIRSDEAVIADGMNLSPVRSGTLYQPSISGLGSGLGLSVRVDCVDSPSEATVGVDFTVILRITNNSNQPLSLRLVSRSASGISAAASSSLGAGAANQAATSSGFHAVSTVSPSLQLYGVDAQLCVTGLATVNIGVLGTGQSIDTPVTVCPLGTGLQELKNMSVVDLATLAEYPSGSLCKVFVHEEPR